MMLMLTVYLDNLIENTWALSFKSIIQKALMVYESLNDLVPGYLSSKYVKRYETRYYLRDSVNKLTVPFQRTNFMKNSFSNTGAVLWNNLPCDVREAKTLSQFNDWLIWISDFLSTVHTAFMKSGLRLVVDSLHIV